MTDRNSAIHHNRGVAYHRLGNYAQAIADYDKAIEINPKYGKAYVNRGIVYGNLGNYAQAIADYDKAIEINPKYGEAYVNRGMVNGILGNYVRAIDDITTAARFGDQRARNLLRNQGIGW